tara:strand:+ start:679 stop:876 length:198 start_codon:yes stop_codon:yes gene_type:complete
MNIADKIKLIDDLVEWVTENVEWAHKSTPTKFGPADSIEQAWEDVRLLAKKGLVAEKFIKEWSVK